MDNFEAMKVLEGLDQLGGIELGHIHLLGRHSLYEPKHVPSLSKGHYEIQTPLVLESSHLQWKHQGWIFKKGTCIQIQMRIQIHVQLTVQMQIQIHMCNKKSRFITRRTKKGASGFQLAVIRFITSFSLMIAFNNDIIWFCQSSDSLLSKVTSSNMKFQ